MERINFNEPSFDKDDLEAVSEVIRTNFVNEGPKTKELEDKLKEIFGKKYIILTTSATAALFLAIKSEAIIRGITNFEVIIPNTTMFATAAAVEWAGGKPVLVDVEKKRGTIDVNKIKDKINKRTIVIIPVSIIGRSPEMDKLTEIAKQNNLAIIEDAAGSLGSRYNDGR